MIYLSHIGMKMNDFTKEELSLIQYALKHTLNSGPCPIEMEYILEKIQSLIDNYCEHTLEYDSGQYDICIKCGHLQSC